MTLFYFIHTHTHNTTQSQCTTQTCLLFFSSDVQHTVELYDDHELIQTMIFTMFCYQIITTVSVMNVSNIWFYLTADLKADREK